MWKKMVTPAVFAMAALTSPVSAATTLEVETSNNLGWATITPGGSEVTPNVVARNDRWANVSWLSTKANGNTNGDVGTYQYIYSLSTPGLFGVLSGLIYVDNRLLSIFVNDDPSKGITFDPNSNGGEFQYTSANGRQIALNLSQFGVVDSITFEIRNDGGPEGFAAFLSAPSVPEPGTWMLMILGLGAIGFAMRRRSSTAVRVQFA